MSNRIERIACLATLAAVFAALPAPRAHAYVDAGADCVFPIVLWQPDALAPFLAQAPGPVNVLRIPPAPSETELAKLGVARISYGGLLHQEMIEQFTRRITPLVAG